MQNRQNCVNYIPCPGSSGDIPELPLGIPATPVVKKDKTNIRNLRNAWKCDVIHIIIFSKLRLKTNFSKVVTYLDHLLMSKSVSVQFSEELSIRFLEIIYILSIYIYTQLIDARCRMSCLLTADFLVHHFH